MTGVDGWAAVAGFVRRERKRRRLTQAEFARALGVSTRLVTDLETVARSNYDDGTRSIVEDALGWEPGDFDRVLAGARPAGKPDPFAGYPMVAALAEAWPRISPEGRALLVQLAEFMGGR